MTFAIIQTGGKQYRVTTGDKLQIEKLPVEAGKEVEFDHVLLIANDEGTNAKIGTPLLTGAIVKAKIIEQGKGDKKIVFKFHHKTRYKKKKGHRQPYSLVEITSIPAL